MKLEILNKSGKTKDSVDLSEHIFDVKFNPSLLSQYIRVYLFNKRQGNSSVKTRGEVSGTGKKPWKQKGTGRARVGQTRNPVWRHGGVAHGPKPKSWALSMPKKMKRLALFVALSLRNREGKLKVFEEFELKEARTKEFNEFVKLLNVEGESLLLVSKDVNEKLKLGARNVPNAGVTTEGVLNAYDVIRYKNVVFEKPALVKFQERYAEN